MTKYTYAVSLIIIQNIKSTDLYFIHVIPQNKFYYDLKKYIYILYPII